MHDPGPRLDAARVRALLAAYLEAEYRWQHDGSCWKWTTESSIQKSKAITSPGRTGAENRTLKKVGSPAPRVSASRQRT